MKKITSIVVFTLILFSSFTTAKKSVQITNKENQSTHAQVPFSAKGSYTWEDVTGIVCNGDQIYFPSITVSYDYHGVYNGNTYMVQGKDWLYGTGTSTNTTENFVADFKTRYNEKYALEHGAVVIRGKINNSFKGDQGTVDAFSLTYQLTFNANGELVVDKNSLEIVCK
ncbi:MAG TPA: hypothetical protein VM010_04860 [Chitinophagaceae bacterium]|nr:hypothetical protein [Chitinophagaceae bacterium]